jgi:hypothetical protein
MIGYDVHHVDCNRKNNSPDNLILLTPEDHAKLHENDFVLWARDGAILGNRAFKKRLEVYGQTDKELAYKEIRIERCKKGLHRTPHNDAAKHKISDNKKQLYKDKSKHPMWGKTTYEVFCPDGVIEVISEGAKEWCSERGITLSNLRKVALGLRKQTKGYTARIINE